MANTFQTWLIVGVVFIALFGGINSIGQKALVTNEDITSDSIAQITGLETELGQTYQTSVTNGTVEVFEVTSSSESFAGTPPEEKELALSLSDSTNALDAVSSVKQIPDTLVSANPFMDRADWTLYLALIGLVLSTLLVFATIKAWKNGRFDNSS